MSREKLLDTIRKYQFYSVELNLYLDNFPDNRRAQKDYDCVSKKLDKLIAEYEDNYGPLSNFGSATEEDAISWTEDPWPWELKNRR